MRGAALAAVRPCAPLCSAGRRNVPQHKVAGGGHCRWRCLYLHSAAVWWVSTAVWPLHHVLYCGCVLLPLFPRSNALVWLVSLGRVRVYLFACPSIPFRSSQVLVDAGINAGPHEDSTRIGSPGPVRRQAVDVSPMGRVNMVLCSLTIGARDSALRSIKPIAECLADEWINPSKGSSNSNATRSTSSFFLKAKTNRQGA
eukprot:TRINITY_DN2130_c0_g1_i4.p2 TRINITY_DN2130_c0_g1~~TRINITY_DN2130_c0_g1_i4.p2  ORF type:complete len:199 (-),score=11.90 TRINITY_DN2130_c0_g1_i4:274-870(-)